MAEKIYTVVYKDAAGRTLQTATFNANSPIEALGHMLTVPSLQPPPGTVTIEAQAQP